MAASSSSGKGKGKPKYPRGVCWNCGKKRHYKDKCPDPVADKSPNELKKEAVLKKSDSTNAVELDSESEAAFLATYDMDSAESDDSGDGDWFDEVVRLDSEKLDWFSEGKVDESIGSTHDMHSPDDLSLPDASDDALPAAESADPHKNHNTFIRAELHDSGCTKHISPNWDDLIDFTDIPPKSFCAANKQNFSTTGTGNLIVDLPNGKEKLKLELANVQYSPEVAYTLVSVGYLDD